MKTFLKLDVLLLALVAICSSKLIVARSNTNQVTLTVKFIDSETNKQIAAKSYTANENEKIKIEERFIGYANVKEILVMPTINQKIEIKVLPPLEIQKENEKDKFIFFCSIILAVSFGILLAIFKIYLSV